MSNGELKGKVLPAVLKNWSKFTLREKAAVFPYFPLLIKLIDARDRLSIHVHPNDEYAMHLEGEYGNAEMWWTANRERS